MPINFYKAGDKEIREIRKGEGGHDKRCSKKEKEREREREREDRASSSTLLVIPYRASVSWDITGCGPRLRCLRCRVRRCANRPVNIVISWETWSLAGAIVSTTSLDIYIYIYIYIVRPLQTSFADHLPRAPLAPNWNWPLHSINSMRGDFVSFAGQSLVSRLRSFVAPPLSTVSRHHLGRKANVRLGSV